MAVIDGIIKLQQIFLVTENETEQSVFILTI